MFATSGKNIQKSLNRKNKQFKKVKRNMETVFDLLLIFDYECYTSSSEHCSNSLPINYDVMSTPQVARWHC